MRREDSVIIFKKKTGTDTYCKLCLVPENARSYYYPEVFCRYHMCVCSPGRISEPTFDNSIHDILLSVNSCTVCISRNPDFICPGMAACQYNVTKMISEYIKYVQRYRNGFPYGV